MDKLVEIIDNSKEIAKGIGRGIISGAYLPVAMTTSIEQMGKEFTLEGDETLPKATASIYTRPLSAVAIYSPVMAYALDNGVLPEAIGALVITNIMDYFVTRYLKRD